MKTTRSVLLALTALAIPALALAGVTLELH